MMVRRILLRGLLLAALIIIVAHIDQAQAAPVKLAAPWKPGETWIAGSGCWAGGSYYRQGHHIGKEQYAIDFNGTFKQDCNLLGNDDGEEILATQHGQVSKIGRNPYSGYGYYVVLDHNNGITSRYAHLKFDPTEKPGLQIGQKIVSGQTIGFNGTTGISTAPHLHFVLYQDNQSIPPSPLEEKLLCDSCNGTLVTSNNQRINIAPDAAKLSHPLNNSLVNNPTLQFIWEDGGDSDNYPRSARDYFLVIRNQAGQEVLHTDWIREKTYTWTISQYGQFYWYIVAGDGEKTTQSITRTFTINQPPQTPILLSPAENYVSGDRTIGFSWQDGGDDNQPRSYRNFVVKLYRNTGEFVSDSDWRLTTSWSTTLTGGIYQWEVCAGDGFLVTCSSKRNLRIKKLSPIDFNGDGVSDGLAHNRISGQVNHDLYRNIWPRTIARSQWSSNWQHYFGYFNNDQYTDKLSYIPESGEVAMMITNSSGLLKTAWQSIWDRDWTLATQGDLNRDGRDDLIAYNADNGTMALSVANSDSTFTEIWKKDWEPNWKNYIGDFDGNGQAELLRYNPISGTARQYRFDHRLEPKLHWQTNWLRGWNLYVGDFNDDGYDDLLAYNPLTGQANLGASVGITGEFVSHHPPYWPTVWSGGWEIIVGNFDGKGPTDALFYNKRTGQAAMDIFNESGNKWFKTVWSTVWSPDWDFNR